MLESHLKKVKIACWQQVLQEWTRERRNLQGSNKSWCFLLNIFCCNTNQDILFWHWRKYLCRSNEVAKDRGDSYTKLQIYQGYSYNKLQLSSARWQLQQGIADGSASKPALVQGTKGSNKKKEEKVGLCPVTGGGSLPVPLFKWNFPSLTRINV